MSLYEDGSREPDRDFICRYFLFSVLVELLAVHCCLIKFLDYLYRILILRLAIIIHLLFSYIFLFLRHEVYFQDLIFDTNLSNF